MDADKQAQAKFHMEQAAMLFLDRSESATAARVESRQQGKRRKGEHWKESRVACI